MTSEMFGTSSILRVDEYETRIVGSGPDHRSQTGRLFRVIWGLFHVIKVGFTKNSVSRPPTVLREPKGGFRVKPPPCNLISKGQAIKGKRN